MTQHELDPHLDHALIDRIVDGGMSPEELRAAVDRLEREPDGWKRCAVAFLEAQVLTEACRALGQLQTSDPGGQVLALHVAPARRAGHRWRRDVAAAAMVVASFAIGWFAHGTRIGSAARDNLVRNSSVGQHPPMNEVSELEIAAPRNDAPAEDRSRPSGDPDRMIRTVGTIRLGPENAPADVPVLAGPGINEDWLAQQPRPVSEHGQAVLARQGYQVEQQRRFFMTVLADGRRVAIPVDHVRIQYTGNEPL